MEQNKKDLSFSSLVREIDKKWGHTYQDPQKTQEGTVEFRFEFDLNLQLTKE